MKTNFPAVAQDCVTGDACACFQATPDPARLPITVFLGLEGWLPGMLTT